MSVGAGQAVAMRYWPELSQRTWYRRYVTGHSMILARYEGLCHDLSDFSFIITIVTSPNGLPTNKAHDDYTVPTFPVINYMFILTSGLAQSMP